MDDGDIATLGHQIDKNQVPPIHQKRILAFVNQFIISTVTFLNKFVIKCENKFIDFERKLQKVEASLLIVEAKLSSISGLENSPTKQETFLNEPIKELYENSSIDTVDKEQTISETGETSINDIENTIGVKACEDARYRKYFKMVQFGVPAPAVKQKIFSEGLDPNILDHPDQILSDGIHPIITEEN